MRLCCLLVLTGPLLFLLAGCNGNKQVDLAIVSGPVATPTIPMPGDTTTVTTIVENVGDSDAGGFDWAVRRDATNNWLTGHIDGLAVNQQATITFTATDPALGYHAYQVIFNSSGSFRESDLTNNIASVTLGQAIDLQISGSPVLTPASPTTSDALTLTAVVQSATTSAITIAGVGWAVTRDGVADYVTDLLPTLAPGGSTTLSIVLPADTAGSHVFGLVIDEAAAYNDSDRTSNSATAGVVVAPAGGG